MNEKIKKIIVRFTEEEDLKNNILDFFSISLLHLQNLLDKQSLLENYSNIEVNHLVDKEIHKVLDAYITMPLDVRNSIIRDNKTGRQFLIEQLSALNQKIENIWQDSIDKNRIVVMHRKITNDSTVTQTELEPENYTLDIKKDAINFVKSFDSSFNFVNFKKEEDSSNNELTPAKFLGLVIILIISLFLYFS